jgi:hypothetical protein
MNFVKVNKALPIFSDEDCKVEIGTSKKGDVLCVRFSQKSKHVIGIAKGGGGCSGWLQPGDDGVVDLNIQGDVLKSSTAAVNDDDFISPSTTPLTVDPNQRQKLIEFYTTYNPSKLDQVDNILAGAVGREKAMWKKLYSLYCPNQISREKTQQTMLKRTPIKKLSTKSKMEAEVSGGGGGECVKNVNNVSSLIPMVDYKLKAVGNNNAQAAAESLISDMSEKQRERLLERRAREEKITGLSKAATRTAFLRRHSKETFSTTPAPFEASRAVDWATSNGVGGAVAASVTQHPTSFSFFLSVCVCVFFPYIVVF